LVIKGKGFVVRKICIFQKVVAFSKKEKFFFVRNEFEEKTSFILEPWFISAPNLGEKREYSGSY
jgi:hypothetical protein